MTLTHKALVLPEQFGKFVVADFPREAPGPGEILIKVQSAALNPVDWKIQKWDGLMDGYPAVLGSDIAGDVEEVGEGVKEFKKGDRVFGQGEFRKTRGAFQQYVVSSASTTSKIPPKFSYDEASTLPMALTTAYSGLYSKPPNGFGLEAPLTDAAVGKYSGNPIVIFGGSSSVGQFTIQLAKVSGFSPIITTASLRHADALKDIGCTHVLDRNLSSDALNAEISQITTKPIHHVYDSISSDLTQQIAFDILSPGGRIVYVSFPTVKATEEKQINFAYAKLTIPPNTEHMPAFYHDHVYSFIEKGWITPNNIEVLPNGLAGVIEGLQRLEADKVSRLKLVARPQETD
ncbi:Dehydrogenase azaJ [Psilocybe cubensis]|uniref:Dehydrogenase azaJ n=2 Tax=Psilocybe cubensis TaxID=181762 RepID=A0ACB8H0C9_PSICU|nr:Dehydrogenase azaJ [Psilocybe cubensis]KAH9481154.1 Dehydrogenase azaJ [Psilocybe cubensis]